MAPLIKTFQSTGLLNAAKKIYDVIDKPKN